MSARRKFVTGACLVLALLALWWWVLPPALGGRTTFYVTKGVSMEPYLQTNDLAILHEENEYEVGDVIAFRSPSLNAVLLHRVIAVEDGRLVTKGDNSDFIDNDRPRHSEVIGTLDHVIDGAGKNFTWLRAWPLQVLGFGLVGLAMFAHFKNVFLRHAAGKGLPGAVSASQAVPGSPVLRIRRAASGLTGRIPPVGDAVAIALLVVSVLLMIGSTQIPGVRAQSDTGYEMNARLDYSATGKPGSELIYTDGVARTGDPVYFSLVDQLKLDYDFEMRSQADVDAEGTFSMDAVVSGTTGWEHRITLVPPSEFEGSELQTSAVLDLVALDAVTDRISALTGVADSKYTIELQPVVEVDATVDSATVMRSLETPVKLLADSQLLRLEGSTEAATAPPGFEAQPPTNDSRVTATVEASQLPESPRTGLVWGLRIAGLLGLVTGFGLLAAQRSSRRNDDPIDVQAEALIGFENMVAGRSAPPRVRFGIVREDENAPSGMQ